MLRFTSAPCKSRITMSQIRQVLRPCASVVPVQYPCYLQASSASSHSRFGRIERCKSTAAVVEDDRYDVKKRSKSTAAASSKDVLDAEVRRLSHLRNVGILAHVDAGKTTVTERMLALAGVVRRAGSVDTGDTVTDYLPAERERGITIQSAAISFEWGWHNNYTGDDYDTSDTVQIHLIDTPGHVDFSVEVNRSVAVLDSAVLVVDAVAGVQAQTETVWRAMTRPSMNNHNEGQRLKSANQDHGHEPLPCLALINKMDKEGCHFRQAIQSIKNKLSGANPIPIQMPLFRLEGAPQSSSPDISCLATALSNGTFVGINPFQPCSKTSTSGGTGQFVGVVDLVHMRAIVWPESKSSFSVDECTPKVINLLTDEHPEGTHSPTAIDENCNVTKLALQSRSDLVAALANVDESMEEYFLLEEEPSNAELRSALRRATLARLALPVMAGAALRGKGVEPLLDAMADLLPSPLDRIPPALIRQDTQDPWTSPENDNKDETGTVPVPLSENITLGHPLHSSLLALAFKVVHMKGRGGSGDGRVVFARVYSGQIKDRDKLTVVSPRIAGEIRADQKPRTERVGGMLELAGGRFDNLENGKCQSGDVCAIIGLKTVVTGDTLLLASDDYGSSGIDGKKKKGKKGRNRNDTTGIVCLAGVSSPKPVLTVRVEAESSQEQSRLSEALSLLSVEDPSLHVKETETATLLSGLGELHIEVTLDRLRREFGLAVLTGSPAVAYRETITDVIETNGGTLYEYDRTIGDTRLQASVHLVLEPLDCPESESIGACMLLADPIVTLGPRAREYLGFMNEEISEEDMMFRSEVVKALISGCLGSLKRGSLGSYALANVRCHVVDVDAEGGLSALTALPGAMRAAANSAISTMLAENNKNCTILEPTMSVEITVPVDLVGTVLSDLSGRRGTVGDVIMGDQVGSSRVKALLRGDVPLVEILGYANTLRSITGGEGAFTAEYKGHSPCDEYR